MKRELAKKMNISIQEFNLLGEIPENIASFDKQYEDMQKSFKADSRIILDSRLSYWCQPQALKLFLDVSDIE
jgi:cytidylate kinase